MNNINLFERLEEAGEEGFSVLERIDAAVLKKEKMNEYYKAFAGIKRATNKSAEFQRILNDFHALSPVAKMQLAKVGKKPLLKHIGTVYADCHAHSKDWALKRESPLIGGILKQTSLGYGKTPVTESRLFRVFASAQFAAAASADRQFRESELDFAMLLEPSPIQQDAARTRRRRRPNYRIAHFCKFC